MKYYLIAGEASGDLHGSNLVKQLHSKDARAEIRCWGGDLMAAAGAEVVKHYRDLAFMGFAEVVKNLPVILRNIRFCKEDILAWKPDVLVLIDYPGFNLRIASWAKEQGLKVVFYISPQVWAWKEKRVIRMKQCIDKMLCILPFEKTYYKERWNWDVDYVGHPLVEVVNEALAQYTPAPDRVKTIALLPGSRKQEISRKLPVMLEVAAHFPGYRFVVAMAPGQEEAFYTPFLQPYSNVAAVRNQTYSLLLQSDAALVTSGTATLETALLGIPEIVCYKGNNISYQIAKRLIRIKYISLVNLIMDKPVVKELIQHELTTANLVKELQSLLTDEQKRAVLKKDYADLKTLLSKEGNASERAAAIIYDFVTG
ncbi:lipid-A-disaccharide synthase [Sediminibacterium ginsengisoli]|uniref:Lipid-A-disaccharide synthase n=1 Tax=Sediminibacterium ginsengisoli TaxID=413434 RepID=A0A1T4KQM0_9BACT|nr:lipid-A-disaccharide synthase [Sediminibacterium ginsengisoli]SJZ44648.1 lipid-A-disaccharide synthase [Sediminibacterium ginsengisoli]